MEGSQLNTEALFRPHFLCWRVLGIQAPEKHRRLFRLYLIVTTILTTIGYPLHLVLGLFRITNMYDVIQNLSISLDCTVCAIKTIAIWSKIDQVGVMFNIVRRQDERLRSKEEYQYMKKVVYPAIRRIFKLFYFLCITSGLTSEVSVLVNGLWKGDWGLMYHSYFPFNPFGSNLNYFVAHMYEWIGLLFLIVQNLVNDTFAATHLALLGGQVHLLCMRVAKIGHDPSKTKKENNEALLDCIRNHKELIEYRCKLEDIVSWYMFFQILFAGINMCVALAFAVLFAKDPFTVCYYGSLFFGMLCEIFPSCYYGTLLEDEFQNVAHALYSCNWMDQDLEFKKNLRIFIENARCRVYVTAWLFRINVNSVITACKNAYSLFALILNFR